METTLEMVDKEKDDDRLRSVQQLEQVSTEDVDNAKVQMHQMKMR